MLDFDISEKGQGGVFLEFKYWENHTYTHEK